MARKMNAASLKSEVQGIQLLLGSLDEGDFIGRASLGYRLEQIEKDLQQYGRTESTAGSVILAFDGGPVIGSRGVDAEFAADAIRSYQELITKQMAATENGGLARSGPVPSKSASRLNITDLVAGSFGFRLEEEGSDEPEFIDSGVKKSIEAVDDILNSFASSRESDFNSALSQVDRRVFVSIKKFYETLYRDSASLKIIEDEREITLDHRSILRARDRITNVDFEDEEYSVRGQLLGLAPIQRRFDFRDLETGDVISGQVGQRLSDDYLERLEDERRVAGRVYIAVMARRTAIRADGSVGKTYTLINLTDVPPPGTALTSGGFLKLS